MRFQNWLVTFKSLFLVWGWRQCVFVSAKHPIVTSCSYMALQRISRVWEYVDSLRLPMFWYNNLVTLWCLFCNISPNDKLFIILDCYFSCLLNVAESYYFLLGGLFPLSNLGFCLVWMHVGATWMDRIYPHRSWNGRINGPLVSFKAIHVLIVVRHNIEGVWWLGFIGWSKSVSETNGWHMLVLWITCVIIFWIGRG